MSTNLIYGLLTPGQCRAARALLGWSQSELARSALVSISTIAQFERGQRATTRANLVALRQALDLAGIAFLTNEGGGVGVRFREARDSR